MKVGRFVAAGRMVLCDHCGADEFRLRNHWWYLQWSKDGVVHCLVCTRCGRQHPFTKGRVVPSFSPASGR